MRAVLQSERSGTIQLLLLLQKHLADTANPEPSPGQDTAPKLCLLHHWSETCMEHSHGLHLRGSAR